MPISSIRRDLGILRSEIKGETAKPAEDIRVVRCPKRGESNLQPLHPSAKDYEINSTLRNKRAGHTLKRLKNSTNYHESASPSAAQKSLGD
jgi:hypothetical protein